MEQTFKHGTPPTPPTLPIALMPPIAPITPLAIPPNKNICFKKIKPTNWWAFFVLIGVVLGSFDRVRAGCRPYINRQVVATDSQP